MTFWYTWLFDHTGGSVLLVIVAHAVEGAVQDDTLVYFAVWLALAVVLVVVDRRMWLGWWALLVAGLVLMFMVVNPLLFRPPRSTRNWASKAVLGERIGTETTTVPIPARFRTWVPTVATVWQLAGVALLAVGLVRLDLLLTLAGLLLTQCAKAWYLDRAVLLFEDMTTRDPHYASWDF
ncbi:hypothetical protein PHK61_20405 [Actinomycetospora lutea]|uniref:DUF6653 family protein n=1 Tax=Actinomycetospora lutea TaxID=663604 RepID=UPI002365C57F|nr:DUF6653 family protein [Actinomycetospora lutea]MDD7940789.1 hypothetical protein [Actinomycetospora lutea]